MRLAVVIPWFGRELKGGAEQHAWQIATRFAARGHAIDVLTTCCRSHQEDWGTSHLPAGSVREPEGFTLRRFRVGQRDAPAFEKVHGRLASIPLKDLRPGVSPVSPNESKTFVDELIRSDDLLQFLTAERETYDRFIFLPYLYGPALRGIPLVGNRAVLQPCLHDEAYAYLPEVAEAFYRSPRILFISEGERELALRLFGPGIAGKSFLVGGGVETTTLIPQVATGDNNTVSNGRYVLYLGRKDAGKNVPLLLKAFGRFRAVRPNSDLRLLLAGHGEIDLSAHEPGTVEDLGLVSETRKDQLLRECSALFQPSQNESLSRVMLEAWMHGKPVGVHRACLATAVAVQRSQGGWVGASEQNWAELFGEVDRSTDKALAVLGENGRRYAEDLADWKRVVERYEAALDEGNQPIAVNSERPSSLWTRINQFLPNLSPGDAISNYALWIRENLRARGFQSEIYVRHRDPLVAHESEIFSIDALTHSDAAVYHHSIGSEITPHLLEFDRPKCLIYHNITPAEFFAPYRPEFARILEQGRADLGKLAPFFDLSRGDSTYNMEELKSAGFRNPSVVPIPVDPGKWNFAPDARLMMELQNGRTNILFVGRMAPNKKQDDLVLAFAHYLEFDPDARLIMVGHCSKGDPYGDHVRDLIETLDLSDAVSMPGAVSEEQLAAYYRSADLFWSMSEHEGFCVPLVEAMWFDLPVLAFRSSAVPETLGAAGMMFTEKSNPRELAALAFLLVHDRGLREKIVRAQRKRRETFLPDNVAPLIEEITDRLLGSTAQRKRTEPIKGFAIL